MIADLLLKTLRESLSCCCHYHERQFWSVPDGISDDQVPVVTIEIMAPAAVGVAGEQCEDIARATGQWGHAHCSQGAGSVTAWPLQHLFEET